MEAVNYKLKLFRIFKHSRWLIFCNLFVADHSFHSFDIAMMFHKASMPRPCICACLTNYECPELLSAPCFARPPPPTHGVFRTAPFRITHAAQAFGTPPAFGISSLHRITPPKPIPQRRRGVGQGACIFGDPTGAAITPQARATLDALSAVTGLNVDTTLPRAPPLA